MTSSKLTPKQLHFCRCVASGMSQAAAYREAYDVSDTTKATTTHEAASRLMRRADIRTRVDHLIRQREAGLVASAVSDREKVLRKLRDWMDSAEPTDGNKIRAAELLGKSTGLFRDVVENVDSKSSEDLLSDLEKLLEATTVEEVQAEGDQIH